MQKNIILLFFLFAELILKAQQINGYVSDASNGEALIGSHIYSNRYKEVAVSNSYGFFSILLHEDDSLVVSFIGYKSKVISKNSYNSIPIQVKLEAIESIEEVTITASKSIQEIPEMGVLRIPVQQLKTIPSLAGESDVMKALQLMPGIKPLSEGQSSFMVRGGSPDQNMILLDNTPLYYVNHLGGFVSIFNTESLNDVKLYKGGFPARYGGRLSSIINVNTKDGNLNKRHSSLTLGMITSKVMFEGPIKKDTLSYFLSARRFMYDIFSRPITHITNNKNQLAYTFYDINAKLNYKPNQKNRLYLSLYSGNDMILNRKKEKREENSLVNNTSNWGNLSTSFRWNHIYSPKLFSNISVYYMRYNYNSDFEYSYKYNDYNLGSTTNFYSKINDFGLNTDFEYYLHPKLNIRIGSNHIHHNYKPNIYEYSQTNTSFDTIYTDQSNNYQSSYAIENSMYCETEVLLSKYFSCNLGYRFTAFSILNKTYLSQEPRILLNINIPKLFSVKTSYAKMSQYVHLLTFFGTSIPADLWMPSTVNVPPQESEIYSVGIFKEIMNKNIEICIEGYYKESNNLIVYKPTYNIFSSTEDWTSAIEKDGKGESKGVEFLLKRKSGRVSGWLSYTISKTTRQFENINNGMPFTYTYDATHDFSIFSTFKLNNRITFSASWTYLSGRAITIPNENYYAPFYSFDYVSNSIPSTDFTNIVSSYEYKNNVRMSPYHRLDVALNYKKRKKHTNRIISLGVYNLYNRQNAVHYYIGTKDELDEMGRSTGNSEKVVYQLSLFPFIPSISYKWEW